MIVTIDPGVKYAAWALWNEHSKEFYLVGLCPHVDLPRADQAIIEQPRFRRQGPARTRDVENLLMAAARIATKYENSRLVWPETWAGQVPKATRHRKLMTGTVLTEAEKALIPGTKTAQKQILDAVGIGLWYFGRS